MTLFAHVKWKYILLYKNIYSKTNVCTSLNLLVSQCFLLSVFHTLEHLPRFVMKILMLQVTTHYYFAITYNDEHEMKRFPHFPTAVGLQLDFFMHTIWNY